MFSGFTSNLFGLEKIFDFQLSSIDIRRMSQPNLEALKTQLTEKDALFAGAFDPKSPTPGLGIAAANLPQEPAVEVYQNFLTMQMQHYQAEVEKLNSLQTTINTKKETIFASKHFEFDQNVKPLQGEDGKPKLFDGPETQNQNQQRIIWENENRLKLKTSQEKELSEFQSQAFSRLDAAYKEAFDDPSDASKMDNVKAVLAQIEKEESDLKFKQLKEGIEVDLQGLPDPDNPEQTLVQFAEAGLQECADLHAQNKAEEIADPNGQAVNQYFQAIQDFTLAQKMEMYQSGFGEEFDPDAMKNAILSMGTLNAEAMQTQIAALGGFNPAAITQEVTALGGFDPETITQEVTALGGFDPETITQEVTALGGFDPETVTQEVTALGGFDPETITQEVTALGGFDPETITQEVTALGGFDPETITQEVMALGGFDPETITQEVTALGGFDPETITQEVTALRGFDPESITQEVTALGGYDPETITQEVTALGGFDPETIKNKINNLKT